MSHVPSDARICFRCGYTTPDAAPGTCPRCGELLRGVRRVRALGWVLLALGAILVVGVGTIAVIVTNIVLHTGAPGATTGFEGGAGVLLLTYTLFAVIISFGAASVASGVWQIRYGRPNRKLMFVVLGIGFGLLIAGRIARVLLHHW
ncbi:MAG: hypothetical protein LC746_12235 [Acidobacteria bacterium]|nr:hypothetical protein [Acidobacteriota bacterium]